MGGRMGYAFAKIGVKLRYLNSAETRRGEHSRVATKVAHDARKDWAVSPPSLTYPGEVLPLRQPVSGYD